MAEVWLKPNPNRSNIAHLIYRNLKPIIVFTCYGALIHPWPKNHPFLVESHPLLVASRLLGKFGKSLRRLWTCRQISGNALIALISLSAISEQARCCLNLGKEGGQRECWTKLSRLKGCWTGWLVPTWEIIFQIGSFRQDLLQDSERTVEFWFLNSES